MSQNVGTFEAPVSFRRCLPQKVAILASRISRFGGREGSPQKMYIESGGIKRMFTEGRGNTRTSLEARKAS